MRAKLRPAGGQAVAAQLLDSRYACPTCASDDRAAGRLGGQRPGPPEVCPGWRRLAEWFSERGLREQRLLPRQRPAERQQPAQIRGGAQRARRCTAREPAFRRPCPADLVSSQKRSPAPE